MKEDNPEKVRDILNNFKQEVNYEDKTSFYKLFRSIKNSNMTPAIMFQLNSNNCKEIFKDLVKKSLTSNLNFVKSLVSSIAGKLNLDIVLKHFILSFNLLNKLNYIYKTSIKKT